MTRRATATRTPAGHWPIDARYPWATIAGSSLHCADCGAEGKAPLPREAGYSQAVESFLLQHRGCA